MLGLRSYVGQNSSISFAEIGRYCSIGPNVKIGGGRHAIREFVSTHPFFYSTKFRSRERFAAAERASLTQPAFEEHKKVRIGHDVWIGAGACVLDGVQIATGAVVGAGAVVTRDVEPYEVVVGVPARRVDHRFEPSRIEALLNSKWWDWSPETLAAQADWMLNRTDQAGEPYPNG